MWKTGVNFRCHSLVPSISTLTPGMYLPGSISHPRSHKCMLSYFWHKFKGLNWGPHAWKTSTLINWATFQHPSLPFINPIYSLRLRMIRRLTNATIASKCQSSTKTKNKYNFPVVYIGCPKELVQTGQFILHKVFLIQPSHLLLTDAKSNYHRFSSLNWCKFVIWMVCWPEILSPTEIPLIYLKLGHGRVVFILKDLEINELK